MVLAVVKAVVSVEDLEEQAVEALVVVMAAVMEVAALVE